MCKIVEMKRFAMLMKFFLYMIFMHCNELLLASQTDRSERSNQRFNQSIANAINAWNVNQDFLDDDKKLMNIMMSTMEVFHVRRLRPFIRGDFYNSDGSCKVDKIIMGIANY